jgi:hypothetical protein
MPLCFGGHVGDIGSRRYRDLTYRAGRSVNDVTNFWRDPIWPEEVVLQEDVSPSEWILPRLLPLGSSRGTRVASIVPFGYPAYARVLHPTRRTEPDPVTTWREVDVTWRAVADWNGRTYHSLMQFGRACPDRTPHILRRTHRNPRRAVCPTIIATSSTRPWPGRQQRPNPAGSGSGMDGAVSTDRLWRYSLPIRKPRSSRNDRRNWSG